MMIVKAADTLFIDAIIYLFITVEALKKLQ
jgi:hypothetical protein